MASCLRAPAKPLVLPIGEVDTKLDTDAYPYGRIAKDQKSNDVLKGILDEMRVFRVGMTDETKYLRSSLTNGYREVVQKLEDIHHAGIANGTPQSGQRRAIGATAGGHEMVACASFQEECREVELSVEVRRIFDVSTVEQTFGVTLNISMRWEMRPGEKPTRRSDDDADWVPNWTPKFRIRSVSQTISDDRLYSTNSENGKDYANADIYLLVIISEQLDLHVFPNDCQSLVVGLASMLPTDQLRFVPKRDGTPMITILKERCLLNDFAFMSELPFTYDLTTEETTKKSVSKLRVKVKVARRSLLYLVNVAFISFLIGSFVLCSWGLHPADLGNRLQVDFALILTALAFKLILMEMLPSISYLTTLDIYILSGFVFLAAATVNHVLVLVFNTKREDLSPLTRLPEDYPDETFLIEADLMSFYVFSGCWVLWNIGFAARFVYQRHSTYSTFLNDAIQEQASSKLHKPSTPHDRRPTLS
jgi:hypothetical protein